MLLVKVKNVILLKLRCFRVLWLLYFSASFVHIVASSNWLLVLKVGYVSENRWVRGVRNGDAWLRTAQVNSVQITRHFSFAILFSLEYLYFLLNCTCSDIQNILMHIHTHTGNWIFNFYKSLKAMNYHFNVCKHGTRHDEDFCQPLFYLLTNTHVAVSRFKSVSKVLQFRRN